MWPTDDPRHGHAAPHGSGHETSDVRVAGIVAFVAGLAVVALVVHLAMWVMFEYFADRATRSDQPASPLAAERPSSPPEPRLQALTAPDPSIGFGVGPADSLRQVRGAEAALLTSYGWVDRPAGVVRMPIERAMDLMAERGWVASPATAPAGPQPETAGPGAPPAGSPAPARPPGDQR